MNLVEDVRDELFLVDEERKGKLANENVAIKSVDESRTSVQI